MSVIVKLLESTIGPLFMVALADSYCKTCNFAKVYWWQRRVLPLALDLHTYIVQGHSSDSSVWNSRPNSRLFSETP